MISKRQQRLIDLAYAVNAETQTLRHLSADDSIGVLIHSYKSHSVLLYGTAHAVQVACKTLARHGYRIGPARLLPSDARRIGSRQVSVVRVTRAA